MATRIAGSYRPGDEELAAELLKRLVELKAKKFTGIKNWQAFLARSLYNAAKNFIRHEDLLRRHITTFETEDKTDAGVSALLKRNLAVPEEPLDWRVDLHRVWKALTPEMRELATLLFEEEGNTSSVAKKLGRPRKTVEYWIQRLRTFLRNRGLE